MSVDNKINGIKENIPVINHIKTKCDYCGKEFKLKAKMIKEKKVTDQVTKLSFKCPKCKGDFAVSYKDKEINENIELMNKISEEIKKKDKWEPMELDNLLTRFNNLKQRNLELSSRYKAIFGK